MFSNHTSIITGCLSGIGKASLIKFAENGSNIFACAQTKTQEFEDLISDLQNKNKIEITPLYFDLTNLSEIKSSIKQILAAKKKINSLINIAGITENNLFVMTDIEKSKKMFDINFFSQMHITQSISKHMMKNKSGSIVFVSSITGTDGNNGQLFYAATKSSLNAAMKTLSIELGSFNIRVNNISPGVIETPMTKELPEDKLNLLLSNCKLKRIGKPEEVADLLVFLASDLSSSITGQNIRVDGLMK